MRVLAVTQIWPNSLEPLSSAFNLQQFAELAKRCDLEVLAAIAHLPGLKALASSRVWQLHARAPRELPRAALLADLPARETIHGIETHYLRQLYLPKVGVPVAVPLYLASLLPHRARLAAADVILGTWAYPDGCASILAARALGKAAVVKVHGSDLNVIAKRKSVRAVLRRVLPRADAMISVSKPLSAALEELGVPRDRIHLVPNGVDATVFAPRDRGEARRALGIADGAKLIVFVGRLEPQKGIGELLEAFARVRGVMPEAVLALIGDGVQRADVALEAARSDGHLLAPGARPLAEIARWLAACDVFTLPSWMEGTPNVVLEALASGRPAVATRVGGIPDVLADPRSGILVEPRSAESLAAGLLRALTDAKAGAWDPETVRRTGPKSWRESAAALYDVLQEATRRRGS